MKTLVLIVSTALLSGYVTENKLEQPVMLIRLNNLLSNQNSRLITVFASYLLSMVIFGGIYYAIYASNPTAFSFNADLIKAQSEDFSKYFSGELTRITKNQAFLEQAASDLSSARVSQDPRDFMTPGIVRAVTDNGTYEFIFNKPLQRGKVIQIDLQFTAKSTGKGIFISGGPVFNLPLLEEEGISNPALPLTGEGLGKYCKFWARLYNQRLAELKYTEAMPWGFWDFLYFSSITQSTTGYGDILPNSTSVRMVVLLQTTLSTALLVVLVNFTFRPASAPTPTCRPQQTISNEGA